MIQKQDKYYIDLARQVATGSKCLRANYGTVIVSKEGTIISTGYNGKPKGSINDDVCYRMNLPLNAQKENCCMHSEVNALLFCDPISRKGGTIYVSGHPCKDCALTIMQSGVARLVYLNDKEPVSGELRIYEGSDPRFWAKYGSNIKVISFTYDEWCNLWGNK